MIFALSLALALQQDGPPMVSVNASPEFQRVVLSVEQALEKGEFELARESAELLPKGSFVMGWDDKAVPVETREIVEEARDEAVKRWQKIKGLDVTIAPSGDLNIRFVDKLPDGASKIPMASTLVFGKRPRLDVQISLHRGKPLQHIVPADAFVEVAHAIGAYLGVADDPLPGNAMYRSDEPVQRPMGPVMPQVYTASNNLKASLQLMKLVEAKQVVKPAFPSATITPSRAEMGTVRQGTKVPLEFKVVNTGQGPLRYDLVPDCGCFTKTRPGEIAPGETATLRTVVDTTEYTGKINKSLVLYSNDPKTPAIQIPVTFNSAPAYRLYRPEGDTVIVPDGGTSANVYLVLPPDSKLLPAKYQWDGIPAKVTMEPWHGTIADPDMDEQPMPQQGYRFQVKLSGNLLPGRTSGTLLIETGDEAFPQFRYSLNAQKGIVALPSSLTYGEMVGVARTSFLVSRPGKPFHILGVTCTSSSLKGVVNAVRGDYEYRIDVIYDGKAPKGDFLSTVKVLTDDPKQKVIAVPLSGNVD